jgi:hypothetical protein
VIGRFGGHAGLRRFGDASLSEHRACASRAFEGNSETARFCAGAAVDRGDTVALRIK